MHLTFSDFMKARWFAYKNKESISRSTVVSCYHCMTTYNARDIVDFTSGDDTAICDLCAADTVIGDASGLPITDTEFLEHMHWYAFCHLDVNGTIRSISTPKCQECFKETEDAYFEK